MRFWFPQLIREASALIGRYFRGVPKNKVERAIFDCIDNVGVIFVDWASQITRTISMNFNHVRTAA